MQCLRSCGAVAVQGAVASQEERWDPSEGGRTGSCNKPATTISKVFPAIVRTARHVRRTCSGKSSSSSSPPVNRGPPPLKLSIILVLVRSPCSPLPTSATLTMPAREAARSITACTELAPDGSTRTIVATTVASPPHRWILILVRMSRHTRHSVTCDPEKGYGHGRDHNLFQARVQSWPAIEIPPA